MSKVHDVIIEFPLCHRSGIVYRMAIFDRDSEASNGNPISVTS